MEKTIYQFQDYKAYLKGWLESQPSGGHGLRGKMAERLGCKTSFISQVLRGHAHFSQENAEQLNAFLGHNKDDSAYFVLLVQLARAGTEGLRRLLRGQMQALAEKQNIVKERLSANKEIMPVDQATYLSSWIYAAVHSLLATPPFQTKASIVSALGISLERATAVLDFLVSRGLAKQEGTQYTVGPFHIHFGHDNSMITRHHLNWRLQAMRSLERESQEDLHYSSVINISEEDAKKLRAFLVDALAKTRSIIDPSPEERLYGLSVDLFSASEPLKNTK